MNELRLRSGGRGKRPPLPTPSNSWASRAATTRRKRPMADRVLAKRRRPSLQARRSPAPAAHYLNPTAWARDPGDLPASHRGRGQGGARSRFHLLLQPQIDVPPFSEVTVTRTCPLDKTSTSRFSGRTCTRGASVHGHDGRCRRRRSESATLRLDHVERTPPPAFPDNPPVTLHSGSTITYSCKYLNMTPRPSSGQSAATNEMCILHGMYWPRAGLDGTELLRRGRARQENPVSLLTPDNDGSVPAADDDP